MKSETTNTRLEIARLPPGAVVPVMNQLRQQFASLSVEYEATLIVDVVGCSPEEAERLEKFLVANWYDFAGD